MRKYRIIKISDENFKCQIKDWLFWCDLGNDLGDGCFIVKINKSIEEAEQTIQNFHKNNSKKEIVKEIVL